MYKTYFLALAGVLVATSSSRAGTGATYIYQRTPAFADKTEVIAEWESAFGTRDARPFGDKGVEQAGRVELRHGRFTAGLRAGALIDVDDGDIRGGVMLDGSALVMKQREQGRMSLDLRISLGILRDYREDIALRGTVTAGRTWGRLNLSALALAEVPLAADRDTVDVVFGLGGSVLMRDRLRLGGEIIGEDLEGFWEEEEAEGGARVLVGPTIWMEPGKDYELKLNAAAFVAPGLGGDPDSGAMIRMVLGRPI